MVGKVVMIASGKGGTGKSTVSVLLGAALARRGHEVLLIELDSGLRSVDIISGVYGKTVYDIEDIFKGRCEADKAIVESPTYKGLSIVSAPYSGGSVDSKTLSVIIQKLKPVFNYILIDTAAGLGDAFNAAATVAEKALIVITGDPVAMRDGRIVADELADKAKAEVRLIVNKASVSQLKLAGVQHIDEIIDTVGVQLIGVVPESSLIGSAHATGARIPESSLTFKAFGNIAARVDGEHKPLAIY